MRYAFMGKILRVNLTEGTIAEEDIPDDLAKKFLGGAGLASRYLYEGVPKGAHPLGLVVRQGAALLEGVEVLLDLGP